MTEFENRLREHAETVKSAIAAPFDIESEELNMSKRNYSLKKVILMAAAVICVLGTTVFAAIQLLNAKQLAQSFGDEKLAESFGDDKAMHESLTDGRYRAHILGIASGREISKFVSSSWELYPDRTYIAAAVERTDGTAMTYEDELMVTPLIQGLSPWRYNIATMHGGYSAQITDGVLYRIIECDSIEYFADREIYLAVADSVFLDNRHYRIDEETGAISANEDYDGTNILFSLSLDKSKANPRKAAEYLEGLGIDAAENEVDAENGGEETEEIILR